MKTLLGAHHNRVLCEEWSEVLLLDEMLLGLTEVSEKKVGKNLQWKQKALLLALSCDPSWVMSTFHCL